MNSKFIVKTPLLGAFETKRPRLKELMLVGLVSVIPAQVAAQNNDTDAKQKPVEHVLVTVPIHKTQAETALPVTVLSGEELLRQAESTIGDTLATIPGLSNASFGPSVGMPVIRGQQGPRVTVLQNSISSLDASNASADHSVSVEPVVAESIEILRGPATLLYGGGAIGGVVNVIDNRVPSTVPEEMQAVAEFRHGSVNDENTAVVKLEAGAGNWAFHIDGLSRKTNNLEINGLAAIDRDDHDEEDHDEEEEEHEEHEEHEEENTDGYIGNSDSDTRAFTIGGSFVGESGYIGLAVSRLENEYGLPSGSHAHHEHEEEEGEEHEEEEHDEEEENVRLDIEQTRYDLRAVKYRQDSFIDTVRWYFTYSDYEHVEVEGEGEEGTVFTNKGWENRLEFIHQEWNDWHGVIGLQTSQTEFSAVGEESFIPKADLNRNGIFLIEDYHSGDWKYEIGLRFDRDEIDSDSIYADTETFNNTSASVSALWDVNERLNLGIALSHSQRAPTVEELFSNIGCQNSGGDLESCVVHVATGAIELGDADIDSEKSNNIDISLSWSGDSSGGYLTFFYNDFNDFVYLANTGEEVDEVPVLMYSQQNTEFMGVEFKHTMPIAKAFGGDFSLELFGDYVQGELNDGHDVPRLPPISLGSRLKFDAGALSANVTVINADDQDKPGENEFETDGYTRWDAGVSYTFKYSDSTEYMTFIKLKNITDEEIRSSVSFLRDVAPEAGRSIEAGVRVMFN